ncbi:hypothetical protein [Bacillus wiedmannii]|uniref:hypothetical protein n=1 Tax=Bacillus wiedmannii TaxID=1890302 RepID=UPI000BF016FD|nr:hypothetical protein [Bacillus wiedmannii]PEM08504.1 hypothetical protein CN610_19825 [Bacillus wiedmannii]
MARARVTVNTRNIARITQRVMSATEEAIYDVSDDLIRTSSETAPHDKGILEQSYGRDVRKMGSQIIAAVDYSVRADNGYDYAEWIHEGTYNLGPNSEAKAASGGGTGMSGQSYEVGNKFLSGVLEGEGQAYRDYIEKVIKDSL